MHKLTLLVATLVALAGALLLNPSPSDAQSGPNIEPVSVAIPPGQTVRLPRLAAIPIPTQPGEPVRYERQDVPVTNQSDQQATGTSDGRVITISIPSGFAVRAEVTVIRVEADGTHSILGAGTPCPSEADTPHVTLCNVQGGATRPISIQFTAARVTGMALAAGCNNITAVLAFPQTQVPLRAGDVARATSPSDALFAIWRFDNARQRFLAWSPLPSAPNDFDTVNPLDPIWLCVRSASTLIQQT
jgi:hypothetical protein